MEARSELTRFVRDRRRLVEYLRQSGIDDLAILHAFDAIPRHHFIPEALWGQAYEDTPLPIGAGQTISSPTVHALCLHLADVTEGDRVLEVGTGSGFQTALLATLGLDVYSIERVEELSSRAASRLGELGIEVALRVGDGSLGWPEHAPFDAIIVGAAAETLPGALLAQLAEGGRLLIPVVEGEGRGRRQTLLRVTRSGNEFHRESVEDVRFVPLIGEQGGRTGGESQ